MHLTFLDKQETFGISGQLLFSKRFEKFITQKSGNRVTYIRYTNSKQAKNIYKIPYYYADSRTIIVLPHESTLEIMKSHLEKIKPDIVYAFSGLSVFDYFKPKLLNSLKIPLIAGVHGDYNDQTDAIQVITKSLLMAYLPYFKSVDLLHVLSDKLKNFCIRHGVSEDKIISLPNGIDTEFFSPGKSKFGEKNRIKKGILFLGRVSLVKNPEIVISSFLSLNCDLDTKLIIVGDGELLNQIKNKYKDPRIIYTGLILDEEKKLDIMRSCQIFVQPSLFEGMSLALLEAMSCGLVSVTSDAGNRPNFAGAGTTIPISKLKSNLPKALNYYINNPQVSKNMGNVARKIIQNKYEEKIIFNSLYDNMEKLLRTYKLK